MESVIQSEEGSGVRVLADSFFGLCELAEAAGSSGRSAVGAFCGSSCGRGSRHATPCRLRACVTHCIRHCSPALARVGVVRVRTAAAQLAAAEVHDERHGPADQQQPAAVNAGPPIVPGRLLFVARQRART